METTGAKTPAACRRTLARLLILPREQEKCIIYETLKPGSVFRLHVTASHGAGLPAEEDARSRPSDSSYVHAAMP